jgi:hypothetical protein
MQEKETGARDAGSREKERKKRCKRQRNARDLIDEVHERAGYE